MELSRTSLCALLLADGDEDLAVLVARANLPDVLDTERDATALGALGLGRDELAVLLPAVRPARRAQRDDAPADAAVRHTLSSRWADLVSTWTAPGRPHPRP